MAEASVSLKLTEDDKEKQWRLKCEIYDLQDDNYELRERVRELEQEMGDLREEVRCLQERLPDADTSPESIAIPYDVLRLIFASVLPPSYLLDSSLTLGPDSPWIQALSMKKSLMGVSRAWHAAAVGLLYEQVSLRRIGQVSAFLRTLNTSGIAFRRFVKKIELNCFVPRGYESVYKHDVERIFELCPHADCVLFTPQFLVPGIASLPDVPTTITHLEFSSSVNFASMLFALRVVANSLISLSMELPEAQTHGLGDVLELPKLKTLRCTAVPTGVLYAVGELPHSWVLPSLEKLTLTSLVVGGNTAKFGEFCKTHGRRLKMLHIFVSFKSPLDIQACLNACPSLQHAILPAHRMEALSHPRVEWVDVWEPQYPNFAVNDWLDVEEPVGVRRSAFPSLRGVRQLDRGLRTLFYLPEIIPPDAVDSDASRFTYQFPGIDVHHDYGRIWRGDLKHFPMPQHPRANSDATTDYSTVDSEDEYFDENDEFDSDYSGGETESDFGMEVEFSETELDSAVLELSSEYYLEEEWEADHEETLAVYAGALDVV